MSAVIFTIDATTGLGHPGLSSEEIASAAAKHNDVLIPFGSVDPHAADAAERARRLVTEYGVHGFKFHPSLQAFEPNDRTFYPGPSGGNVTGSHRHAVVLSGGLAGAREADRKLLITFLEL